MVWGGGEGGKGTAIWGVSIGRITGGRGGIGTEGIFIPNGGRPSSADGTAGKPSSGDGLGLGVSLGGAVGGVAFSVADGEGFSPSFSSRLDSKDSASLFSSIRVGVMISENTADVIFFAVASSIFI